MALNRNLAKHHRTLRGFKRCVLINVVVEEDSLQVVDFVLAHDRRVVLQADGVVVAIHVGVLEGDPVVPGHVARHVFIDGQAAFPFGQGPVLD